MTVEMHKEIKKLKKEVMLMGNLALEMLESSMDALLYKDAKLAKEVEDKKLLEQSRLSGELELESARFEQTLKQHEQQAQADHEVEVNRLKRLQRYEEVRNLLSDNRVLTEFVEKLPEIASSMQIDRYTVLSGSAESPLVHTLTQILSLFEEHGLRRFLNVKKEAEVESSTSKPGS